MAFLQPKRRRSEPVDATGLAVLAFLRDHRLTATPAHFAAIHEYLSHPDDLLAKAVDAVLMSGVPLAEADLGGLQQGLAEGEDCGEDRDGGERSELRHQARHLAEVTAHAASANERFGKGLASDLDELFQAPDTLIAQVHEMIQRTASTEQQLASALQKIETLRDEVEAERGNAGRDALTGLLNRRGVQPLLDAAEPGDVIAIVDLDRFKDINDRYGHAVGDRVLKVVGGSLSESFGPHEVARWGGEEFLAVLSGLSSDAAAELVEHARDALKTRRFRLRGTGQRIGNVSFSAGLAVIAEGGVTRAMVAADAALYQAKSAGRDCIRPAADETPIG